MLNIFRALRHRNFRIFFAGQAISLIGTWMQNIAQSWLVYDLTHSSFWLGFIGFIGSLPVLIFSLVGGTVADRVSKRPLILGLQSVLAVLALVLGLLTTGEWVRIWHIGLLGFLMGLVHAFEMPARQSFISEIVDREDLANAIALNSAMFNSARLIGPALAGILIVSAGTGICFLLNSASYLAVIAGLSLMNFPPSRVRLGKSSILQSTLEGLQFIRQTPRVLAAVVLLGTMTIFGWSYSVLMPIFADQILQTGPGGLGWLVSCNGVGAVTAALTLAMVANRIHPNRLLFTGIGIFCVSVTALAFSRVFWFSAVCLVFVGFGLVTFFTTSNTTLQKAVPDEMRGRVMGIYAFVFMGFFPLGSLQAGTLAHLAGAPFAVIFGMTVCALAAVTAAWYALPISDPMITPANPSVASQEPS